MQTAILKSGKVEKTKQSARDTEKYESPVDEYWGTSCSHKSTLFYPHFIPIVAAEIVK